MQRPKIFTSDSTPKDRRKPELLYTGLDTPDYDKSTKQQENRVEKQRSVRLRDKIGKLRTEMTGIRRSQRQHCYRNILD